MGIGGEEANWRAYGIEQMHLSAGCERWENSCETQKRKEIHLLDGRQSFGWCFSETRREGTALASRFALEHFWAFIPIGWMSSYARTRP